MAMVNQVLNLNNTANVKDSRWLTLEVCREYQRNKCTRSDTECKFAHPPPHVEVQNGRVTACFDSIKGKCQRKDPPCKYLHPPQHLREQLLQNGRNNLILRNLHIQAVQALNQPLVPGMIPTLASPTNKGTASTIPAIYPAGQLPILIPDRAYGWSGGTYGTASTILDASNIPDRVYGWSGGIYGNPHPYLAASVPPTSVAYNPYSMQTVAVPNHVSDSSVVSQQIPSVIPAISSAATQQKLARADRLEPQVVEVIQGKKRPRDHADDIVLQSAMPGMIPFKRVAVPDKNGIPVYQPGANLGPYQQAIAAMHLQQQQFIPTLTYKNGPQTAVCPSGSPSPAMTIQQQYVPVTIAGHPPSMPRF